MRQSHWLRNEPHRIACSLSGAPLAFKSFDVPTSNDDDDMEREDEIAAERAAEVAIELIREQGSLSPGERTRAALICLFARAPCIELLILDEPTFGLDLLGQRALTQALRAWSGGLVVASHDQEFLAEIGSDRTLRLGP